MPDGRAPGTPTSTPVSTRARTLSSMEEGIPSVRAIRRHLSGSRPRVVPRAPRSASALAGGEWVEPHLCIVRLTAPAVLVLRAVVDQQQHAHRGQALDQAIQQGLGLGIDPVQIFKDEQQRLLRLAQQQMLEGVERTLPSRCGDQASGKGCRPAERPGAQAMLYSASLRAASSVST